MVKVVVFSPHQPTLWSNTMGIGIDVPREGRRWMAAKQGSKYLDSLSNSHCVE